MSLNRKLFQRISISCARVWIKPHWSYLTEREKKKHLNNVRYLARRKSIEKLINISKQQQRRRRRQFAASNNKNHLTVIIILFVNV